MQTAQRNLLSPYLSHTTEQQPPAALTPHSGFLSHSPPPQTTRTEHPKKRRFCASPQKRAQTANAGLTARAKESGLGGMGATAGGLTRARVQMVTTYISHRWLVGRLVPQIPDVRSRAKPPHHEGIAHQRRTKERKRLLPFGRKDSYRLEVEGPLSTAAESPTALPIGRETSPTVLPIGLTLYETQPFESVALLRPACVRQVGAVAFPCSAESQIFAQWRFI